MAKRASLSLSVNAIVVLVLALTMLGVGISFTKNMFSKIGGKLLDQDFTELPNPTKDDPISILNTVKIPEGESGVVPFKFLNYKSETLLITSTDASCECGTIPLGNCKVVGIPTSGLKVDSNRYGKLGVTVDLSSSSLTAGSVDICTVSLKGTTTSGKSYSASTTFTVKVK